jgi:hypothetical protein
MILTFERLRSHLKARKDLRRQPWSRRGRWAPGVDGLEERLVLSTLSSISGNFNGTAIPAGDSVWFSSVAKVQGAHSSPVTIDVTDQTISFTANGTAYTLSVPNTSLVLSPTATSATTTYDAASKTWETTAPVSLGGNVFLGGVSFPNANGLPGGIKNVTWQGSFSTDTAGINLNWQWAASGYSQFGTDLASLGVKPVDDNQLSGYKNSDHAGTPENFESFVVGGATGGGGSNFTGSYSSTASVTPSVGLPVVAASLSGYVTGTGGEPLAGVTVDLIGTDGQGNAVNLSVMTDVYGHYIFNGLAAGTYEIEEPQYFGTTLNTASTGTVNGVLDGTAVPGVGIQQITLNNGDNGINYVFGRTFIPPA